MIHPPLQRGGWPALAVGSGVYNTLKAAGKHARTLDKNNLFRKVTVNRSGIPPSMQRRMYHN
jgi:hypothetical protein